MFRKIIIMSGLTVLSTLSISPLSAYAQSLAYENGYDLDDLALSYGDMSMASIATGSPQPIKKAPASVTVITAEKIRQLGANDLDDVLATVPGLHVSNNYLQMGKYIFRGLGVGTNSEALLLINGIPIRNLVNGNHYFFWGGMPVNTIAKIEVIRGPGSALYGADAFAGVINVWTKQARDIDGVEAGVRVASFNTRESWLQYGGKVAGFDLAVSAEVLSTDGHEETISADAQSAFDDIFGTTSSAAPGPALYQIDSVELRIDAKRGNWQLRAGAQLRDNMGAGVGGAEAIDTQGEVNNHRYNTDITYRNHTLADGLRLEIQASYFLAKQSISSNTLFAPADAFGGEFPEGVIGSPLWTQHNLRSNLALHYSNIENHEILMGGGYEDAQMDSTEERRNFEYIENNPIPQPLGELMSFTGDEAFIPEKQRTNHYFLLQDEWRFATDWQLIAGIRYDDYSDFGSTTNPRFALVWDTSFNLTSKLLYGSAFRAPSFNELYGKYPSYGDESIKPQTIDTIELVFNYQATTDLQLDFNFFFNEIDKLIVYESDGSAQQATNSGEIHGAGTEIAFHYTGFKKLQLEGNYAFQKSRDQMTDHDVGFAPNHEIFLLADWQVYHNINLVNKLQWVGKRPRPANDQRDTMDGYSQWDILLHSRFYNNKVDTSVGVYNVTDADVRDPSLTSGIPDQDTGLFPGNIPDDIPKAGRHFSAQISYRF